MRYKNLTIIGTSHISPESIRVVERIIRQKKPAVIALELDKQRLASLLARHGKRKPTIALIKKVGFKGWLFAIIGAWLERSLGKKVGTVPGSEMLKAVQLARELRIPIVLIDQDITITLKRLSEAITWKEKWHLLLDVFGALLFRHGVDFDISGVPSKRLLEKLISHVKARYPNIFRVIVEERNEFMAKALSRILFKFRKKPIVAVVGAGHEAEVLKLVKRYLKQEFETTLKKR